MELSLNVFTRRADSTRRLGIRLGALAEVGDIILLTGELGAGKTCLTQGIARGLGIEGHVVSPTFVLLREYQGRLPLYHIDFYRLDSMEEVASMGLEDYLYGDGVCVVEWAEKGLDVLPDEHLLINIERIAPTERELILMPRGPRYEEILARLKSMGNLTGRK